MQNILNRVVQAIQTNRPKTLNLEETSLIQFFPIKHHKYLESRPFSYFASPAGIIATTPELIQSVASFSRQIFSVPLLFRSQPVFSSLSDFNGDT